MDNRREVHGLAFDSGIVQENIPFWLHDNPVGPGIQDFVFEVEHGYGVEIADNFEGLKCLHWEGGEVNILSKLHVNIEHAIR